MLEIQQYVGKVARSISRVNTAVAGSPGLVLAAGLVAGPQPTSRPG
jgi:hypothetical protein